MPMRGRMTDADKAERLRRHGAGVTALPMKFGPTGYDVAIPCGDIELIGASA